MSDWTRTLVWLLAALNGLVFCLFLADRLTSRRKKSRIPAALLWFLCALGGSLGGLLGMALFRCRTDPFKNPAFVYGVPALFWMQLALGLFFVIRGA